MKNLKRILTILLAIIMCVSIVGCGKTEDKGNDTSTPTGNTTSDVTESEDGDVLKPDDTSSTESAASTESNTSSTQAPAVPDNNDYVEVTGSKQEKLFGNLKGTKLRVPGNVKQTDWEKKFIEQFEKKYGIDVTIVPMSFAEQQTKLPSIIASKDKKNYIDVCTLSNVVFLRYAYGNMIKDFTKYVDKTDSNWTYKDANFPAFNQYTLNDKIYGSHSIEDHETYIFYNKTYFKEKGIKDPYEDYYLKNNWTFDTFRQVAKQSVSYAKDGKTIATYGFATWNYFAFAQAAGNSVIKQNGNKWEVNITDKNGMAALNLLYECANDNSIAPFSTVNYFKSRKVAMFIERPSYATGSLDAYNTMSDKVGMVPMPKLDKNADYYFPVSADGIGVAACAQNVPGAVAWIYEYNKAIEQRNSVEPGLTNYRKRLSVEHEKIRKEYLKKAKPSYSLVDGLSGWYNGKGNREKFLDMIIEEKKNPAVTLDSLLPLLKDSLKATVG
ncbi:MAG: extracellular solute-binding protein [Clostridia bacterium]|nr:extracellular solute-binding protein [Clostridia bacterium]